MQRFLARVRLVSMTFLDVSLTTMVYAGPPGLRHCCPCAGADVRIIIMLQLDV